ncbi:hypothetical protein Cha6605_6183 (plasmid) [Chamaesiphon minutus PCC 6605]|uniref:Uncharacterized protein n=1 Tax=Chamaesiphon minutus (strain ATCC 27169 / PCC 6605) TaxID=1173020 RepID=K9UQP8_CHAP6|nr:hypothetical protein Cha6605_6183 [Chamaesiphon minutus PCC 6605]
MEGQKFPSGLCFASIKSFYGKYSGLEGAIAPSTIFELILTDDFLFTLSPVT